MHAYACAIVLYWYAYRVRGTVARWAPGKRIENQRMANTVRNTFAIRDKYTPSEPDRGSAKKCLTSGVQREVVL